MAGKTRGASARITQQFPRSVSIHCTAHHLNLCVVNCCSIPEVQRAMEIAESICCFFSNSPKWQLLIEQWVTQLYKGEWRQKLKSSLRQGGWNGMKLLRYLLICSCLWYALWKKWRIQWNWITSHNSKLSPPFFLCHFLLIITLTTTTEVLQYPRAPSIKLQGQYVDIVQAYKEITMVKCTLISVRGNVDTFHTCIYNKAKQMLQW